MEILNWLKRKDSKIEKLEKKVNELQSELFNRPNLEEKVKDLETRLKRIESLYIEPKRYPQTITLKNEALLITDADLDGLVSAVLLNWAGWKFNPLFLKYGLTEILNRVEEASMVIIADFTYYDDTHKGIEKLLQKGINILYFDHHLDTEIYTSKIKKNDRFKLVYNNDNCWTAKIIYDLLKPDSKIKHPKVAEEYVNMAGITDGKIKGLSEEGEIVRKARLLQGAICAGRNYHFCSYVYQKLLDNSFLKDRLIWEMAMSYNPSIEKYAPQF